MLRGKDGRNRLPLVGKLHLSACYRAYVCESAEKTVRMLNSRDYGSVTLKLPMDVVPDELMRPEMAKALLSKITFSSEPSDG